MIALYDTTCYPDYPVSIYVNDYLYDMVSASSSQIINTFTFASTDDIINGINDFFRDSKAWCKFFMRTSYRNVDDGWIQSLFTRYMRMSNAYAQTQSYNGVNYRCTEYYSSFRNMFAGDYPNNTKGILFSYTEVNAAHFNLWSSNDIIGNSTISNGRAFNITIQYRYTGQNTIDIILNPNDYFTYGNSIPYPITLIESGGVSPDPYSPGGTTEPSSSTGDFDNTSDPIPPASLPTLSAVNTNFITMYAPDLAQLQALASYMWSASFDLDTFKKLFTDPMAAILGLSIVPVAPPAAPASLVTLGNITTSVSMPKITSQYVTLSCGTLNVNEYWGAYLDYSPYTKMEIYLPYIGIQTLDADDIMGRSITVTYNIDILSGACVAMLTCGDSILYSFAGSCATSVPITGRDWTNVINGIIGIATGAAGIAVAGATGGAAVAAGAAGGLLNSTANSLSSLKPTVQKSGTMASAAGMLGLQTPYLILTRPRQALPERQNAYTGYPSYITQTLENVSGYTIVDNVHLDSIPCTAAEHNEIMDLLKEGVIF